MRSKRACVPTTLQTSASTQLCPSIAGRVAVNQAESATILYIQQHSSSQLLISSSTTYSNYAKISTVFAAAGRQGLALQKEEKSGGRRRDSLAHTRQQSFVFRSSHTPSASRHST